jgi:DAK2 domain fusion protein YloV
MERKTTLDGYDLKAMFSAGAAWLEKIVPDINALNVYPVPDGDCGTNMLLTLRASLEATGGVVNGDIGPVADAVARGALMGARGNSGVILSQIWRGLAQCLTDKKVVDAGGLAEALQNAADTAYLALSNPVEGTILTIIRDAASAADREASSAGASPVSVLAAAVAAARASVLNTPELLNVLKEAGVVDAGGHGLYTFLEGALLYLQGDTDGRSPEVLLANYLTPAAEIAAGPRQDNSYGFCTQFMIRGLGLNIANLRTALDGLGESLIVVGDVSDIRVHIHTHDPEKVTKLASTFGNLFDINIRNMDEQHQDFLLMQRGRTSSLPAAVVAVVNGDGLVNVFADLGVAAIVPGGPTMNPSTTDILRTVEDVPSENIILLPNNKNIIPAALLVRQLTKKNLKVIPTKTIPQGISALVSFVPEDDFETNVLKMSEAIDTVRTIEIARATRATRVNNLDIKKGQFIGLFDGELLAAGDRPDDVIFQLLARTDLSLSNIMTIYYGKDASEADANRISDAIDQRYPEVDIGVVKSGQPNYYYIVSVE